MSNKSVSDFVAAAMDAVLTSESHKSLFGTQYKYASDENDAKGCKCSGPCSCMDSASADDNDARAKKDESSSSSSDSSSSSSDSSSADDALDVKDSSDSDKFSAAFDVAIDSLLTASAALDSVGMEKSSAFSLKLATLVVEAKKADGKDKEKAAKEKAKAKADKEKAKAKAAKEKEAAKAKAEKEKAKAKADKEKAAAKASSSSK